MLEKGVGGEMSKDLVYWGRCILCGIIIDAESTAQQKTNGYMENAVDRAYEINRCGAV